MAEYITEKLIENIAENLGIDELEFQKIIENNYENAFSK